MFPKPPFGQNYGSYPGPTPNSRKFVHITEEAQNPIQFPLECNNVLYVVTQQDVRITIDTRYIEFHKLGPNGEQIPCNPFDTHPNMDQAFNNAFQEFINGFQPFNNASQAFNGASTSSAQQNQFNSVNTMNVNSPMGMHQFQQVLSNGQHVASNGQQVASNGQHVASNGQHVASNVSRMQRNTPSLWGNGTEESESSSEDFEDYE